MASHSSVLIMTSPKRSGVAGACVLSVVIPIFTVENLLVLNNPEQFGLFFSLGRCE